MTRWRCNVRSASAKRFPRRRAGHTFRYTVGSTLAEMGEHRLMIREYLRHANLRVTNKYLQANDNEQAFSTRKVGGRHSARGRAIGKQISSGPLDSPRGNLIGPKWTQTVFAGFA